MECRETTTDTNLQNRVGITTKGAVASKANHARIDSKILSFRYYQLAAKT